MKCSSELWQFRPVIFCRRLKREFERVALATELRLVCSHLLVS